MVLAIDIGNTLIKTGVYTHQTLIEKIIFDKNSIEYEFQKILKNYPEIKHVVVSSVSELDLKMLQDFFTTCKIDFISHNNTFPFQNLYTTPTTLGIDRMVLAAGATLQYPYTNRLVIDAGTCVTYDYINDRDQYLGGAISPGLRLRYQALNNYTANLPLLSTEIPSSIIGNSTNNAIHSGVVNGLLLEIDGVINQFKAQYATFIIILTGGDAEFLAVRLKNTIFANSNFLLDSLNLLHIYTTNND